MRLKRLDGLRAVAVILVVIGENNVIDLGWTGVELSFVLTGFLMTRILRDFRTDKSYWSRFYLKRAVRVVPLFIVALVVNKLALHHLSLIGLAGYLLLLGDVVTVTPYMWGALGMAWSIAVGAHFVLLWSVAVRFLDRRKLITIAIAVLAFEPTLRHFYTPYSHSSAIGYNVTPFCLDSLVAGSLLALLIEAGESRFLARWSGWAAMVLAAAFLLVSHLLSPWFIRMTNTVLYNTTAYSTLAAISFFVLAWVLFLKEGGVADRLLSSAPFLFIARISYGIYLFHPLVNAVLKKLLHIPFEGAGEPGNRKIFPLAILISIAVSTVLNRYVEQPIHAWGVKKALRLQQEHEDPARSEQDSVAMPG